MRRIAVVRTCAVGDAVQCTPLLQQLRADEPGARLIFFTSANVVSLFDGAPFVDEVVGLSADKLSIASGRRGMMRAWWQIAGHGPFDALISLEPTWMRNLGSLLVRSPIKAGLSFTDKRKPFELFTQPMRITGDSRKTRIHASEQYLSVWLGASGTSDRGFGYNMRHLVADAKESYSPSICIAPGTGNVFATQSTKQWHPKRFIELGGRLSTEGFAVTYLGGSTDLGSLRPPETTTNLLGKTTLRQAAVILSQSAAVVSNDSGLFHLAQAVDCPAVGIFGPTSPRFTGVFRSQNAVTLQSSLPCMPCYRDLCDFDGPQPKPCCMSEVSVDRVLQAIRQIARSDHGKANLPLHTSP